MQESAGASCPARRVFGAPAAQQRFWNLRPGVRQSPRQLINKWQLQLRAQRTATFNCQHLNCLLAYLSGSNSSSSNPALSHSHQSHRAAYLPTPSIQPISIANTDHPTRDRPPRTNHEMSNELTSATAFSPSLEAIRLAAQMYNAAREGNKQVLEEALESGLPANLTNEKGDTLVSAAGGCGPPLSGRPPTPESASPAQPLQRCSRQPPHWGGRRSAVARFLVGCIFPGPGQKLTGQLVASSCWRRTTATRSWSGS